MLASSRNLPGTVWGCRLAAFVPKENKPGIFSENTTSFLATLHFFSTLVACNWGRWTWPCWWQLSQGCSCPRGRGGMGKPGAGGYPQLALSCGSARPWGQQGEWPLSSPSFCLGCWVFLQSSVCVWLLLPRCPPRALSALFSVLRNTKLNPDRGKSQICDFKNTSV